MVNVSEALNFPKLSDSVGMKNGKQLERKMEKMKKKNTDFTIV